MALHDDQVAHAEVGLSLASEKFEQELDRAITDFKSRAGEIDRTTATAEIGLDLAPFRKAILEFKAEKLKLEEEKAQLGAEISKKDKVRLLAEIEEVKRSLKAATREKIEFEVDLTGKQQMLAMEKALATDERSRLLANRRLEDDRAKASERFYTTQKRSIAEEGDALRRNDAFDKQRYDNQKRSYVEQARANRENEAFDQRAVGRVREGLANDSRKLDLERQYKTILEDTLGKQSESKPVDLDIKKAEAKLALLRFDIERAGGDVNVDLNINRSQLSILENIKRDLSTSFTKAQSFVKKGPDVLPGFGRIPLGAALTASPALVAGLGGATSLVGAVGGGAIGAGAIGAGIGTGLATNVLGLARAFDVTAQETHQADTALIKYEESSRKYGATNVRTLKALAEYNNIINAMTPAAREFSLVLKDAQEEWNKFTKAPIEKDSISVLRSYAKAIKEFTPGLAANTNETGGIVAKRADSLIGRLSTPQNKSDILSLGKSANQFLNPALIGAEHLVVAFLNVASAAAKIFGGAVGKDIQEIGEDLENATKPGEHLNNTIKTLGKYASDTFGLVTSLGKLLVTVFGISAQSGDSMLQKMTAALDRWDEHLKTVEGRKGSQNFFKVSAEFLEELTPLLLTGGKLLGTWAAALIPAANTFLEILKVTTEVIDRIGKMVGLHKPLETLGVAMGAIFAASKFRGGIEATSTILSNLKNMDGPLAALKGIVTGDIFKKQSPLVQGAKVGSDLWYERIVAAATEGGAIIQRDMVAGAAAGGKIAGEEEAAGTAGGGLLTGGGLKGAAEKDILPIAEGGALTKIIPSLIKGGLVAGLAYLGTQALGSAVGGTPGKDISKYGGEAAIGAGIGTVLLPGIGTAVGAAVLPGLLAIAHTLGDHGPTHAEKLGKDAHLSPTQTHELTGIEEENKARTHKTKTTTTFGDKRVTSTLSKQEQEENREAKFSGEQKIGRATGASLAKTVLGGREFPDVSSIVRVTRTSLKDLGPAGQQAMLEMVKKMVETLEHEGRVVPGSVRKMLDGVRSALTGLGSLGEISGHHFTDQLARSINSNQIQGVLSNITANIQKNWGPSFGKAISTHDSFSTVISSTREDLSKLQYEMHHGTQLQKEVATAEYKEMRDGIGKYISNTRHSVESEIDYLNRNLKTRGPQGPLEVAKAYRRMRETIEAEVATGARSAKSGFDKINKELSTELSHLNPKNPGSVAAAGVIGQEKGEIAVAEAGGKAQGGLVQFGTAGAKGTDNIPIQMMVGSGEVGAVFTGQQQQVANHMLAPIGGLPGLFSTVSQPHYAAHGGFVPDPGKNFSAGKEPQIAADLRRMGEAQGWTIHGISGYRSPSESSAVGGFPNDPHTRGEAADIGINSSLRATAAILTAGLLAKFGLERPFYPADPNEINHVQLLGSSAGQVLAAAGATAAVAAAQAVHAAFKRIVAPHAKGSGVFHAIAQQALNRAASSANARLARVQGRGGSAQGGVSGPTVTASEFGGHNDPSAYQHRTASGAIANDSLMGFAELSNPPGSLNFTALGGLPMGSLIKVGYHGRTITIPKVDVGQGGTGIGGHIRAIDLTYAASRALGAPGLENVNWKRAAKGGMYGSPALLVGEHQNEYVINPSRSDNAEYLHQAATDMGYRVTPAAKGKKPVVKQILKSSSGELKELPHLSEAANRHGVPLEAIQPLVSDIESALKTEQTTYHSLQNRETKAIEALKNSKTAGAHALGLAYSSRNSGTSSARKAAALTLAAAQNRVSNAQVNGITGAPNTALDSAHAAKGLAEKKAAASVKKAEEAGERRVKAAEYSASQKLKAAEKKLDHIKQGLSAIEHGKVWEHTQYIALPKLKADVKEGQHAEAKIKSYDNHIQTLNKQIAALAHGMNIDATRFTHTKDPSQRAALTGDWNSKLGQREGLVDQLTKAIAGSKAAATDFTSKHPTSPHISQVKAMIEATETEEQASEDLGSEDEGFKEAGISSAVSATPESFIESLPGGTADLKQYEEEFALAQTRVVPDNPNTPANEELPGLKAEVGPALKIQTFWESVLGKARTASPALPPDAITSIANSVTAARSTAYGLKQSIETAQKGVASQGFQESQAFSQARLQLYKDFGSNFAPIFRSLTPAAVGSSAAVQQPEQKTVHLNVTNHFSHPPDDPHIWSNGIAWELQAAV